MRPGVMRDRVAFQHFAAGDLRQALGVAADFEERRTNALVGERLEDLGRRLGGGAVVEGEDDLMVGERDCPRIGLEADLEAALRADLDHARRSELVRPAISRARSARAKSQRYQRPGDPH